MTERTHPFLPTVKAMEAYKRISNYQLLLNLAASLQLPKEDVQKLKERVQTATRDLDDLSPAEKAHFNALVFISAIRPEKGEDVIKEQLGLWGFSLEQINEFLEIDPENSPISLRND